VINAPAPLQLSLFVPAPAAPAAPPPCPAPPPAPAALSLPIGDRTVPVVLVRNPRARRYVLRLRPDGVARLTLPRGGSAAEAWRFARKNIPWLERQFQRQAARPAGPVPWAAGAEILFRGERVRLECGGPGPPGTARFAGQTVPVRDPGGNLRPEIERHLRRLAETELPARATALAALHQLPVGRITVRDQRSRWGSCSPRRTLSLNWRLVQTPSSVRDYIILHELAHLREMNHSRRFWREVARLCPAFAEAEGWLKTHNRLLRD
jgi:predicted metal-dependent hydrolase